MRHRKVMDRRSGRYRRAFLRTGEITHYGDGRGERDVRVADAKRSGKRHGVSPTAARTPACCTT
jgi:hypothetical protein